MTQGVGNNIPAFGWRFLSQRKQQGRKGKPVLPSIQRPRGLVAVTYARIPEGPEISILLTPGEWSVPSPRWLFSTPRNLEGHAKLFLQGASLHLDEEPSQAWMAAGHVWYHGPPASSRPAQQGAKEADTMDWTHVRFLGEENYSLWTERLGQAIHKLFKRKHSPQCPPSPNTS
jgi:hypothetical protein